MSEEPIPAALRLAELFDRLGIDYWLGGSLASSIHGEPRSTHDVDFVVDMTIEQCEPLIEALGGDYFVYEEFVRDAVSRRDSFQVVQKDGYQRVDVFVMKPEPFAEEQKRRRRRLVIDADSGAAIWVTSAEDIVLQKLVWYRKGGEVSDLQWRDVLSVLKTNPRLDRTHLDRWALELGITDLLARASVEAGVDPGGDA